MVKYLSDEWCALTLSESASIQQRAGATVRLQYKITGTPDGDQFYYWNVVDGQLTQCAMGELDGAEVTLVLGFDDAIKVQKLELDPQVAFMQGRMKVEGNLAKLMALLPVTNAPDYKDVQAKITANTEY